MTWDDIVEKIQPQYETNRDTIGKLGMHMDLTQFVVLV